MHWFYLHRETDKNLWAPKPVCQIEIFKSHPLLLDAFSAAPMSVPQSRDADPHFTMSASPAIASFGPLLLLILSQKEFSPASPPWLLADVILA